MADLLPALKGEAFGCKVVLLIRLGLPPAVEGGGLMYAMMVRGRSK
jgi:hypothetical protein